MQVLFVREIVGAWEHKNAKIVLDFVVFVLDVLRLSVYT